MTRSERWLPVVGFEDAYEVSDLGRVRSLDRFVSYGLRTRFYRGRDLRPGICTESGHVSVSLGRGNKRAVHDLVLAAFIGPAPKGFERRHLNGRADDNRLANLKYGTRGQNGQDKKWHDGQSNYKLTPADVRQIKMYLAASRGTQRHLATLYGVAETTISAIKHGRIHVDV